MPATLVRKWGDDGVHRGATIIRRPQGRPASHAGHDVHEGGAAAYGRDPVRATTRPERHIAVGMKHSKDEGAPVFQVADRRPAADPLKAVPDLPPTL